MSATLRNWEYMCDYLAIVLVHSLFTMRERWRPFLVDQLLL